MRSINEFEIDRLISPNSFKTYCNLIIRNPRQQVRIIFYLLFYYLFIFIYYCVFIYLGVYAVRWVISVPAVQSGVDRLKSNASYIYFN